MIVTTDNTYVCVQCGFPLTKRHILERLTTPDDVDESGRVEDVDRGAITERATDGSGLMTETNGISQAASGAGNDSPRRRRNSDGSTDRWTRGRSQSSNRDSHPQSPTVMAAIPAYNEGRTVEAVVRETIPNVDVVVVVDDGSDDDTAHRARASGATVIEHDRNMGYGASLKTIFREANLRDVDHLVVLDGDGQHDAADISKLVSVQQETNAEIVIGSRFEGGGETDIPLYRRAGLKLINRIIGLGLLLLGAEFNVRDTQSGYRVYDRRAIRSLVADADISDGMEASIDILFHAGRHRYDVKEVGTTVSYEGENTSTHNPVSHGMALVKRVFRTVEFERPITVLAVPGLLSASMGLVLAFWAFSRYPDPGQLSIPFVTLIVVLTLVGLFACITGSFVHTLHAFLDGDEWRS